MQKKITVQILLFGISKDLVGKQKMQMELPVATTVANFRTFLQEDYPELIELNYMAIAINSEYAADEVVIHANDEIAIIPPVSGG